MIDNTPHRIFRRIQDELQSVFNTIGDNSIRTRLEQIQVLEGWKQTRYYLLYHDRSGNAFNSDSLLAVEITDYRDYLRHNGYDLQDYRDELLQFVSAVIAPQTIYIQKEIDTVEREATPEPTEPDGYPDTVDGIDCISYHPGEYEAYRRVYEKWRKESTERGAYYSLLLGLLADCEKIQQTIEKSIMGASTEIQSSPSIEKPKRINGVAKERHERIVSAYDRYKRLGKSHSQVVDILCHDLKNEYKSDNAQNRRKVIMAILRLYGKGSSGIIKNNK